jgi:hypothetical protein
VKAARSEPGWRNGYEIAKILLNQTIEACLLDRPVEQRLDEVNACIRRLEEYRDEITKMK